MPARTVTESIIINAEAEIFWELITRIDGIPDWYDSWDRAISQSADTHVRQGTSFQLIRHGPNGDSLAHCLVTDLSPGRYLEWVQTTPCKPTTTVTFQLVPLPNGNGTELHQTRARCVR